MNEVKRWKIFPEPADRSILAKSGRQKQSAQNCENKNGSGSRGDAIFMWCKGKLEYP